MKKLFVSLVVFWVVVIVVLVIAGHFLAEPKLKSLIEEKGSAALEGQLTVGQVHIVFWPPLSISLENLKAVTTKKPAFTLDVPDINLSLDLKNILQKSVVAKMKVTKPILNVTLPKTTTPESATEKASTKSGGHFVAGQGIALGLNLLLDDAQVNIKRGDQDYSLSKLDVSFLAPSLGSPWNLKIKTVAQSIPLEITSLFTFDGDIFESQKTDIDLSGIKINLGGKSTLSSEEHKWDAKLDVQDLKTLIIPPELEKNLKSWGGVLKGQVHAEHPGKGSPWKAQGVLQAKNLETEIDFENSGNHVQGPIGTEADLDFAYQDALTFNKLQATIDLTKTTITSASFAKPSNIVLKASVVAQGNQNEINISQSDFTLGPLSVSASGKVSSQPGGISDLKLTVPSTNLAGLEKLFPALASTPLTGKLEVKATVHGDLKNPKTLGVNVNPLTLEKVRGAVNWISPDKTKSVHGPLTANGKIILVALGQKVSSALVNIQADLSDLDISMAGQLMKPPRVPLRLNLQAAQKGQAIQITKGDLTNSAGVLSLKGSVQDPRSPKMNLNLVIPKLDLNMLSKLLPSLEPWKLGGVAQGKISLAGLYDMTLGIEKSPLILNGSISATIPRFNYVTKKTPVTAATAGPTPEPSQKALGGPQSILPRWPIMQTMKFSTRVKLQNVSYNDLQISGVDVNLNINRGLLSGVTSIQKIFGGFISADKIQMQLLTPFAPLATQLTIRNLDLAEALAFGAPKWKDAAKGMASGLMDMHLASHESKDFIGETNVSGHLQIKNGFLSTVSFDQYLNEKLSSIPGLGSKKIVSTKGTAMEVSTIFDFNHSILNLKTLDAVTPEKNEINVAGIIKVDQSLDLKGKVWLGPTTLSGDVVKCNADSSGRLVIPVHVTGTATKPEYNIVEGTAQQLLAQMATCQANKLKDQYQDQIKNRVQDEAKKSLMNLFGH